MKVLLINGSPKKDGNTFTALSEVAKEIEKAGVETEFFHIGKDAVHGCIGCGTCYKTKECVFKDDALPALLEKVETAAFSTAVPDIFCRSERSIMCSSRQSVLLCS